MNPLARQLSELKFALQELESAVQQPRDEKFGIEQIIERFPTVLGLFCKVICEALNASCSDEKDMEKAIIRAYHKGWLKGDLALWLRLLSDFYEIKSNGSGNFAETAIAQDVRSCSYMLWESYELLTARFRWQTQVRPVPEIIRNLPKMSAPNVA